MNEASKDISILQNYAVTQEKEVDETLKKQLNKLKSTGTGLLLCRKATSVKMILKARGRGCCFAGKQLLLK